jgi:hypothetical protein
MEISKNLHIMSPVDEYGSLVQLLESMQVVRNFGGYDVFFGKHEPLVFVLEVTIESNSYPGKVKLHYGDSNKLFLRQLDLKLMHNIKCLGTVKDTKTIDVTYQPFTERNNLLSVRTQALGTKTEQFVKSLDRGTKLKCAIGLKYVKRHGYKYYAEFDLLEVTIGNNP